MSLVFSKKLLSEFRVVDKVVYGLELLGPEVKSLKLSRGSLDGARILVRGGELFLVGAYIPIFQEKNNPELDVYRTRRLIAHKKEIFDVTQLGVGNNLQIAPLSIFLAGRMLKLECVIGERLKKYDKREVIKKRDLNRKG
jgi:SsrA-binding protein